MDSPSPPGSPPAISNAIPRTVILWVIPRSTSTMFECALLQKTKEFKVLHEPTGDAFYFGKERVSTRYPAEKCPDEMKDSTFAKVWKNIVRPAKEGEPQRTFSKDMAYYIFPPASCSTTSVPSLPFPRSDTSNPTLIPTALLLDPTVHHSFLIRSPAKAVPSFYRLCNGDQSSVTGFEFYDPAEAGYRELRLLYDFLRAEGRDPLIIDSEELIKNPEVVMKRWCDDAEIEFDPSMLQWNEGTREHFAKWPGFHTSAENSTGVGKGLKPDHLTPGNHSRVSSKDRQPDVPKIVEETIAANMEDYEYLRKFVRE